MTHAMEKIDENYNKQKTTTYFIPCGNQNVYICMIYVYVVNFQCVFSSINYFDRPHSNPSLNSFCCSDHPYRPISSTAELCHTEGRGLRIRFKGKRLIKN